MLTLTPLVSLATLLPFILAQSSGTIYINASSPDSGSSTEGCVILVQIAALTSPAILTSMVPICPASARNFASQPETGMTVDWPLTTAGLGAASSMALYAQITGSDEKATAGCVMNLSQMQAMYLLGRDLNWNNGQNQLWDYTANGWLRDPQNFNVITCGPDTTLIPQGLELPSPYTYARGASIWSLPITLKPGASPSFSYPSSPSKTGPSTSPQPAAIGQASTTNSPIASKVNITYLSTSGTANTAMTLSAANAAVSTLTSMAGSNSSSAFGSGASFNTSGIAYASTSTTITDSLTLIAGNTTVTSPTATVVASFTLTGGPSLTTTFAQASPNPTTEGLPSGYNGPGIPVANGSATFHSLPNVTMTQLGSGSSIPSSTYPNETVPAEVTGVSSKAVPAMAPSFTSAPYIPSTNSSGGVDSVTFTAVGIASGATSQATTFASPDYITIETLPSGSGFASSTVSFEAGAPVYASPSGSFVILPETTNIHDGDVVASLVPVPIVPLQPQDPAISSAAARATPLTIIGTTADPVLSPLLSSPFHSGFSSFTPAIASAILSNGASNDCKNCETRTTTTTVFTLRPNATLSPNGGASNPSPGYLPSPTNLIISHTTSTVNTTVQKPSSPADPPASMPPSPLSFASPILAKSSPQSAVTTASVTPVSPNVDPIFSDGSSIIGQFHPTSSILLPTAARHQARLARLAEREAQHSSDMEGIKAQPSLKTGKDRFNNGASGHRRIRL